MPRGLRTWASSLVQSVLKEHEAVCMRRILVLLGALRKYVVHYLRHFHEAQDAQLLVQLHLTRPENLYLALQGQFERTLLHDAHIPAKVRCNTLHFTLFKLDYPDVVSSEPSCRDTTEDTKLIISRSPRDCETDAGRRGV